MWQYFSYFNMAASDPALPPTLKPIQHYIKTAGEHEKRDPIIAYYCLLHAMQQGMAIDAKSPDSRAYLLHLMDKLEGMKQTLSDKEQITSEVVGQAYVENYALQLFLFADNEDRSAHFGKPVVKSFYTAGMIMDVLTSFGPLSEDIEANRKYAKWKAAYIHKCLKEGITPQPGPLTEEGEVMEDLYMPDPPCDSPSHVELDDKSIQTEPIETCPPEMSQTEPYRDVGYPSTDFCPIEEPVQLTETEFLSPPDYSVTDTYEIPCEEPDCSGIIPDMPPPPDYTVSETYEMPPSETSEYDVITEIPPPPEFGSDVTETYAVPYETPDYPVVDEYGSATITTADCDQQTAPLTEPWRDSFGGGDCRDETYGSLPQSVAVAVQTDDGEVTVPGPSAQDATGDADGFPSVPGGAAGGTAAGYPAGPSYTAPAPAARSHDVPTIPPQAQPSASWQPPPNPGGVSLGPSQYQKAQKYCKYAGSALQYEDSQTAIDNLTKALKLLTTGQE